MEQEMKQMDMAPEESLEQMVQEGVEERKRQLRRHKLPEKATLASMLTAMTKAELDDIRFNLNVTGASSLKKAELIERLCPAITAFAERWMMSLLEEEYQLFRDLAANGGKSEALSDEDDRLDYLRGLGFLSCGMANETLIWFMPEEVLAVFSQMDTDAFHARVLRNTKVARLAAGLLYAYGYLNYEQLFEKVCAHLTEEERPSVNFADFVGILLNASCWKNTVVALPQGVKYYTLIDEEELENEQLRRSDLDFADLTYEEAWAAGADSYTPDTPPCRALIQFFMQAHGYGVLKAADVAGEIIILLQNGGSLQEAVDYLDEIGLMKDADKADAIIPLLAALNNATRLWPLKGHTPEDLMAMTGEGRVIPFDKVHKARVGRNDPCPCGSGKKYKNCCLRKDEQ
ncbi:YecA family protein [Mitsuokella multacida]|uniref:YecA family protein n=1 Tax=Mitsuokella multacida TaxID=52226 RepID=UPI003F7FB1C1